MLTLPLERSLLAFDAVYHGCEQRIKNLEGESTDSEQQIIKQIQCKHL